MVFVGGGEWRWRRIWGGINVNGKNIVKNELKNKNASPPT